MDIHEKTMYGLYICERKLFKIKDLKPRSAIGLRYVFLCMLGCVF
jgi:hypothetical protein